MADHFYSVVVGDVAPRDVTFGTSTSSEAVELRVTDATTGIVGNKQALLNLVDVIRQKIAVSDAPA
jgi:hypothetical protein